MLSPPDQKNLLGYTIMSIFLFWNLSGRVSGSGHSFQHQRILAPFVLGKLQTFTLLRRRGVESNDVKCVASFPGLPWRWMAWERDRFCLLSNKTKLWKITKRRLFTYDGVRIVCVWAQWNMMEEPETHLELERSVRILGLKYMHR